MNHLEVYDKHDVLCLTHLRKFETKIGERIALASDPKDIEASLQNTKAKYVIVGVPEVIGSRANKDEDSAGDKAWFTFLSAFLNVQSNDFLEGSNILLLGHLDFAPAVNIIEVNALTADERIAAYRHAVNAVDEAVEQIVKLITKHRKMPIIIGGGQNNAYSCIKGAAKGWHKAGVLDLAQINAVNLDAKSDYMPIEGRHNGNPFRYADEDGYLEKYCIVGLHEDHIQQNVWMDMVNNPFIDCITYEDIFIHEKRTFMQAVAHASTFTDDTLCGVELDLSCIQQTPSGAGVTAQHARHYVTFITAAGKPAYLHISEAKDEKDGALISYLVSDFVKAMNV